MKLLLAFTFTLFVSLPSFANCITVHLSQFNPPAPPADGAQAWRDAFNVLAQCKGGTLDYSGTDTKILTTVVANFHNLAAQVTITGGSNGRVTIATGGSDDGFVFQNLFNGIWKESMILGGGVGGAFTNDALNAIHLQYTNMTFAQNFIIGLGALTAGGSTIKVGIGSSANIVDNQIRACRSHSALNASTIVADNFVNLSVTRNEFWDYFDLPIGNGATSYYETGGQAGYAWVKVGTQSVSNSATPVEISNNFFDEGAVFAVLVIPSSRILSVILNRNVMNVGLNGGYWIQNVEYLSVDGGASRLHTGPPQTDAIRLISVRFPTIRNFVPAPTTTANRLTVDGGTVMLKVIESPFVTINNNAQKWSIEKNGVVTTNGSGSGQRNH